MKGTCDCVLGGGGHPVAPEAQSVGLSKFKLKELVFEELILGTGNSSFKSLYWAPAFSHVGSSLGS